MTWHLAGKLAQPWAVQLEALRRSDGRPRFGLFLEMGLGKSGVVLNEYVDHGDVDLCIVVAPQAFKLSWLDFVSEYDIDFIRSGFWPRDPLPFDWEQGVYALNYEAISRSRARDPLLELFNQRRVMLVLDESKALGNPRSGWSRAAIELAKRATMVRELNGTPVTQSPLDLYAQLRALGELNGMTSVEFRNRYCVMGGYMGKQILPEFKNGDELARILDRCMFRALKSEWRTDLPPRSYSTIHLELTAKQRRHYKTMVDEFYAMVDGRDVTVEMVIGQMLKLQQIASGFILPMGGAPALIIESGLKTRRSAVCSSCAAPAAS